MSRSSMHHARHRRLRHRGFSLVEIMIALAVGGIALTSIYAVGSASTRHFREQQRVANTQTAVRMAMALIKKDFQRAGFLASPNASLQQESCGTPPAAGTAAAILNYTNNVTGGGTAHDLIDAANANPGATFDDVFLMGNYLTTGEYPISAVSTDNGTVALNASWQSFRRDFRDWNSTSNDNSFETAAFERVFTSGRMVRVHALNETHHFATIGSTNSAVPNVTFTPVIPGGCSATGGWLAPVNTIHYHVQEPTNDETVRAAAVTGPMVVLRRTEVRGDTRAVLNDLNGLPVDDRTVLDYVVAFNLKFRSGSGTGITGWTPIAGGNAVTLVSTNPQQIRSVIIDIAARTPDQDTSLAFVSTLPMRTFQVFPDTVGAARVRMAHAEVFLPNVAYKAYQ